MGQAALLPSPTAIHDLCPLYSLQGSLSLSRIIEGFDSFSRFGHAMANLGDINGDGLDGKRTQIRCDRLRPLLTTDGFIKGL